MYVKNILCMYRTYYIGTLNIMVSDELLKGWWTELWVGYKCYPFIVLFDFCKLLNKT